MVPTTFRPYPAVAIDEMDDVFWVLPVTPFEQRWKRRRRIHIGVGDADRGVDDLRYGSDILRFVVVCGRYPIRESHL